MKVTAEHFKASEYDEETLEMDYTFGEEVINISIYNGDEELDQNLKYVNTIVEGLHAYHEEAITLITDELYTVYSEEVVGLTEDQFRSDLNLLSLYFTGDEDVEFTYEGGAYFGDHILSVEMSDGAFLDGVAIDG